MMVGLLLKGAWGWVRKQDPRNLLLMALLGIVVLFWFQRADLESDRDRWKSQAKAEREARQLLEGSLRDASAKAEQQQKERLKRDAQQRGKVSDEEVKSYKDQLADLNRRFDERVRQQAAARNQGVPGRGPVPGLSTPASGADDAAANFARRCAADAAQLTALQEWNKRQAAITP
jgi:hypothetical protein